MAKKVHDLVVKVGEFEKDGETKGKYKNVGVMLEKDDGGRFLMIDPTFNFAGVDRNGHESVLVSMFDLKKDKEETKAKPEPEEWS